MMPKSPEPTAVGAVSSAVAVRVTHRRLADLTRRGGKTFNRIQQMTTIGHPDLVAAPVAATKLFTVGGGLSFAPLALPPMNNFG
jgi:hypothetical protein